MINHRQVRTSAPPWSPFKRIRVDELMRPLLRHLWACGIRTMLSCQETEPGVAYIIFGNWADGTLDEARTDAGRFVALLEEHGHTPTETWELDEGYGMPRAYVGFSTATLTHLTAQIEGQR